MGFVNEKSLAGEVRGQVLGSETVQGRMGTCECVFERTGLVEVTDDPLYRAELAFPRPLIRALGT